MSHEWLLSEDHRHLPRLGYIRYTLTATVDSEIARDRPPLPITSVTSPFYATVTDPIRDLGKYFDGIPFISSGNSKATKDGPAEMKKPIMVRLPSGIEVSFRLLLFERGSVPRFSTAY